MSHTPLTARVVLDNERTIGTISPLLFGGFAEHMGRWRLWRHLRSELVASR